MEKRVLEIVEGDKSSYSLMTITECILASTNIIADNIIIHNSKNSLKLVEKLSLLK